MPPSLFTTHPALRPYRRIYRWEEPHCGLLPPSFDEIRRTELTYINEYLHNGIIHMGIGAEGPAEIEEFKDPYDMRIPEDTHTKEYRRAYRQRTKAQWLISDWMPVP